MIKHKPKPKCNVVIGNKTYKANGQGIVELPDRYEQFNPIEEPKKKKKVVKNDK